MECEKNLSHPRDCSLGYVSDNARLIEVSNGKIWWKMYTKGVTVQQNQRVGGDGYFADTEGAFKRMNQWDLGGGENFSKCHENMCLWTEQDKGSMLLPILWIF